MSFGDKLAHDPLKGKEVEKVREQAVIPLQRLPILQHAIVPLLAWILQGTIMTYSLLQFHFSSHFTPCYSVSACIFQ